jgi:hypothetical protein
MISDDPFYEPHRSIEETVQHLKKTLERLPKPMIAADWERLAGTQRVRHKPSGCLFEWSFKDSVFHRRQTRLMVLDLLDCPSNTEPNELKQITEWARLFAAIEATCSLPPKWEPGGRP